MKRSLALLAIILPLTLLAGCGRRMLYSFEYNVNEDQVHGEDKPPDCDWDYAPLGNKGCHYEREISVTRYSTDTKTSQPIVTYDDGKTWNWVPEGEKPGPVQVYVTWQKVQDGQWP
jgi:predicted small lipoprotein YifL